MRLRWNGFCGGGYGNAETKMAPCGGRPTKGLVFRVFACHAIQEHELRNRVLGSQVEPWQKDEYDLAKRDEALVGTVCREPTRKVALGCGEYGGDDWSVILV